MICSNVYDDVINFEICGFMKNKISWEPITVFYQIKNFIHWALKAILWQEIIF